MSGAYPGPMRGGAGGASAPGPGCLGGPGGKQKHRGGSRILSVGDRNKHFVRILIRKGGGGPPKKNVGLATLGMIVTTLYLHTHKHISGE